MNIHPGVVGIDVSKHHLDVFDAKLGRSERLANTPAALVPKLAAWRESEAFVLFEATGSYDRALARMLVAAGIAFARVNPGRARDFARAAGFLAKTDAVDARMLAAMAQCLRPKAQAAADPQREAMATLHKRRDQLVAARQQERTRKHECQDEDIAADLAAHLAFLDQAIARITQRIKTLIASSQTLEQAASLLTSVPGVGLITAATLLALMPELGNGTPKSIAALAGLAPFNTDSGAFRGTRCVRGGRKRIRDALYMAAVSAAHSKSRFAAFYKALRSAGKPPKLAFIALARKLLVTLNAILRDKLAFQP